MNTFAFLTDMPAFAGTRPADLDDLVDDISHASVGSGESVDAPGPVAVLSGSLRIDDAEGRSVDMVNAGDFWVPVPGLTATAISGTKYLVLPDRAVDLAWEGNVGRAALSPQTTQVGMLSKSVTEVMEPPLIVGGHTVAQAVAEAMTLEEITAALVTDGDRLGIVTDQDFRARMVAAGRDSSRPIREIATFPVQSITSDEKLVSALEIMLVHGIKHLPVMEGPSPVGLISDSTVFGVVDESPLAVRRAISGARDPAALAEIYDSMPRVADRLIEEGMEGLAISRLLATFAEASMERAVRWATTELGPEPGPFAWLAFGSLARREQALGPDQDHALSIGDGYGSQAWFSRMAASVTDALVTIGYPRCNGGVMASEPDWRAEQSEWRSKWVSYLTDASPQHLLQSQIVFDCRVVIGDPTLAEPFFELRRRAAEFGPFMAQLAKRALDFRPPLGFMGRLQTERSGEHAGTFNIKSGAILPIVQFARIHSLAIGSGETSTVSRLKGGAAAGAISDDLASMLIEGYELAILTRLEHQVELWKAGLPLNNNVDPGELTSWRRMGLREAFKAVRSAQESLSVSFLTGLVG